MGNSNTGEFRMSEVLERSPLRLSSKKVHGRVVNVVAALLRKNLYIPNVYLNPKIPGVPAVDVLAVDRGGSGDLHAVDIKLVVELQSPAQRRTLVRTLKASPFHFKYLAVPQFAITDSGLDFTTYSDLFDDSGIGRIGILSFDSSILDASSMSGSAVAQIIVSPERFLVRGAKLTAIEKFLAKARPDMEVRI
jgi:hypothetical protein